LAGPMGFTSGESSVPIFSMKSLQP
jgi:hypothetical protein